MFAIPSTKAHVKLVIQDNNRILFLAYKLLTIVCFASLQVHCLGHEVQSLGFISSFGWWFQDSVLEKGRPMARKSRGRASRARPERWFGMLGDRFRMS